MTPWTKRAIHHHAITALHGVQTVVFWAFRGDRSSCGCRWQAGIREDTNEQLFIALPCPAHLPQATLANQRMFEIPRSDRLTSDVYEDLFEQALQETRA